MNAFVAVTDSKWYRILSSQQNLEDVNFWQPGGNREFSALSEGELFLFKLHSPENSIVGGGLYEHSSLLPVSLAWDVFGICNGATSLQEMRGRIQRYRKVKAATFENYTIGCILLSRPFFFPEGSWISVPTNWRKNIVQGRTYNSDSPEGGRLFEEVERRMREVGVSNNKSGLVGEMNDDSAARYGSAILIKPRLGQAAFRIVVTDAYDRRCAVSGERVLPVLEASHIRPFGNGGPHDVSNGILLRSDLHTLFDRGYLTITPAFDLEVSKRIREEFYNGKEYYALHGMRVSIPNRIEHQPSKTNLAWHNDNVYNG